VLAQEEARQLYHLQIGDELLLIGIAAQPDAAAGRVLVEAGATVERLRERATADAPGRKKHHAGHLPFTPTARKVLEGALEESRELKAPHVGVEHLLIALTRLDGDGVRVLRELGVDVDELRNRAMSTDGGAGTVEETQATPWSTPRADVEAQLTGIESTLQQILTRLAAIEKRLPE
jgi:ATP-dependent Clp protease ATP-binding subunit ClpC